MASAAMGQDQPSVQSEHVEEPDTVEVPLQRKRRLRRVGPQSTTSAYEQFSLHVSAGMVTSIVTSDTAGPSAPMNRGKAPMPDVDIPAEFV